MTKPEEDNDIFKTAADFINNSNHPVFLTGRAGTGKTTFLKYIKENTNKNTVIVAPTGVAAINAGGTTIHSFFQLPFTPFLPGAKKQSGMNSHYADKSFLASLRLTSERRNVIEQLELLIIDEISMVRCDVLDAIDAVLKYVRHKPAIPYGGVQVLYIGDMYQLRPVVKDNEWQILRSIYDSEYFFSSHVVSEQNPVFIELKKVYRQKDNLFISLLNQVRNNEITEEGYNLLHSRYQPGFTPAGTDNFITLTTHNSKADIINEEALSKISQPVFNFTAIISGIFSDNAYPADNELKIKPGAQVMFLKNDSEKIRRYYNGKIGVVQKIEDDKIYVECKPDGVQLIEVKKETWRNIKYTLNSKSGKIEEEELGSFSQFPLRLAWAITIHKSQGLTFQNAVIDAGNAFAAGQVYVALSRCTSLNGIVLRSKINFQSLKSDERIVDFSLRQQNTLLQQEILGNAKKQFQQDIIYNLFNFRELESFIKDMAIWLKENNSLNDHIKEWLLSIRNGIDVLLQYGEKFLPVLNNFFLENSLPEEIEPLQERLKKATSWFFFEMDKMKAVLLKSPVITDNRQLAKDYDVKIQKVFDLLNYQAYLLNICQNGFILSEYTRQKALFQKVLFTLNSYSGKSAYMPGDISHPALYQLLMEKRQELASEKNIPVFLICKTQSLEEMANYMPQTTEQLARINGFGKAKLKQFGNVFLNIIKEYCTENNLDHHNIPVLEKKAKNKSFKISAKSDTKKISLDMYISGHPISEIATERNLSISTIEGHVAHYIENGELAIDRLIDEEKKTIILDVFRQSENKSLTSLKEQLPGNTYGEIKWVIASEKSKIK